jgi:hypothetical protein
MIKIEKNILVWTSGFGYAVSDIIAEDGLWQLYVLVVVVVFS